MSNSNNMHKYDDIINLPHYTSSKRPRMAMIDRAAQFSPFAALTGYDAAVKETARLTEDWVELDEYQKSALNDRLQILQERLSNTPVISLRILSRMKESLVAHIVRKQESSKKLTTMNVPSLCGAARTSQSTK